MGGIWYSYANLISVVLWKLSAIIPKYHGHVLKYTGDGLIGYLPEPSLITKTDLQVDCALELRRMIYMGLDQILKKLQCPSIQVRIGIDTGEAFIKVIGDLHTKQHKDIIGSVVSLAAKIQAITKPGELYLGETTYRNLHTVWKENTELVELKDGWNYKGIDRNIYRVFRMKFIESQGEIYEKTSGFVDRPQEGCYRNNCRRKGRNKTDHFKHRKTAPTLW